ncbi:lipopolysaccharide biosynthesis protein [Streptomyces sp. GC420]|uniref:lipopolysaccharide biosynthesis protein n=1 Tax=Streptomyces sp. GC420 TaxID=2697568 RepID=UPI0014150EDB|nr:lipopolysaccharide biosynthesis protein [Streptomyces sp. GC420]NBM20330.1 lipopolysaccharide biosynthesis protein [Streptomyces sp. GC420]
MTEQQPPEQHERVPAHARSRRRLPRWWPVPLGVVLGAASGAAFGVLQTPQYAATSNVVVVPIKADHAAALGYAQAYGRVAVETAVLDNAAARAGVSRAVLRRTVRVATSPDAPMIAVTGTATRPGDAADLANAVAGSLIASGGRSERATGVDVRQFARAVAPSAPVSITVVPATLTGACAGGLLGALVQLVRPRRRLRQEDATAERTPAVVPAPSSPGHEQRQEAVG